MFNLDHKCQLWWPLGAAKVFVTTNPEKKKDKWLLMLINVTEMAYPQLPAGMNRSRGSLC